MIYVFCIQFYFMSGNLRFPRTPPLSMGTVRFLLANHIEGRGSDDLSEAKGSPLPNLFQRGPVNIQYEHCRIRRIRLHSQIT